jgi:hypothetical protein
MADAAILAINGLLSNLCVRPDDIENWFANTKEVLASRKGYGEVLEVLVRWLSLQSFESKAEIFF